MDSRDIFSNVLVKDFSSKVTLKFSLKLKSYYSDMFFRSKVEYFLPKLHLAFSLV